MRRLSSLLLVILLAGCTSDEPVSEAAGADPDALAAALHLQYEGCSEHFAVTPVPVGVMGGDLPAGFEPVTFDPAGQLVQMLAIAFVCELDGREAREFMGSIAVTAPPEFTDADAVAHAWLLGGWVTDDAAKAAYDAWGVDLMDLGPVELDTTATPLARLGTSRGGDSSFSAVIDTFVQGQAGVQAAGHARVFYDAGLANATAPRGVQVSWTESVMMEGESTVRLEGGLPPFVSAGIGVHNWGNDYNIRVEAMDLVAS